MNIFFREVKSNFRSLLIWAGIVILFVVIGFSKFSAYEGNPELLAVLDDLPPAMLSAFNFNAFNLTTITGFFGVMFSYFALLLSVAAVMWGSDIISKEERDKTVEFSLSLPVKRSKIVTAKILAAIVNCIGILLLTWGVILFNATNYQSNAEFFEFVSLSMLALFIMQMIFLAVGIFLGCAMKYYKQASSVGISVLLVTYFVSIIAGLNEKLDILKYFTPFKYFDPASLLHDAKIDVTFVWISLGLIAVLFSGAYITYSKRDLYI